MGNGSITVIVASALIWNTEIKDENCRENDASGREGPNAPSSKPLVEGDGRVGIAGFWLIPFALLGLVALAGKPDCRPRRE